MVGDLHGKYLPYLSLIENVNESIQLGDAGIGFGTRGKAEYFDSLFEGLSGKHRFIRGNHDDPDECRKSSHFINDGHLEANMMFMGGALSIDKAYRTSGINWWMDEELSIPRLGDMLNLYEKHKPDIMITHDFPESIAYNHLIPASGGSTKFPSRTRDALDAMFKIHKPKIWLGAHWHFSFDKVIDGTRFIVLPELGYIDLDIESV